MTVFYYPKTGGIQALCDALAAKLSGPLHRNAELISVNLRKKTAVLKNVGEVRFKRLVNTMPLKDFCALVEDAPATLRTAARKLRCTRVDVLNIGFEKPARKDMHWAYFPEDKFAFYRAGAASNFSAAVAPRGTASFYVEKASLPGETENIALQGSTVAASLCRCGLAEGKLVSKHHLALPCAYVLYDANRKKAVETIMSALEKNGVISTGRYGGWKYSFMEEALLVGKAAAEAIAVNR